MAVLIVASSEPRVGRSLVAAAVAYRMARDGKPVTLARLSGDESAGCDAATFASIESVPSAGKPIAAGDVASLSGDVVLEAPAGPVRQIAMQLGARVVVVGTASAPATDAGDALAGTIVTKVPESEVTAVSARSGLLAVLPEDRILAAPSIVDIAARLNARWLHRSGADHVSIDRVMLGTVASDAASPYFSNHERKCVITRYDKTDIQLAALFTNVACMVITGEGVPSPYLIDRVSGRREEVALLQAPGTTVEVMTAVEDLFGRSRFDGGGKLERAVELLDAAEVPSLL